tara:strand:- start:3961 stop:4245 length:285 start_codon:yes stop_codon:yes gene_type:complete
MKLKKEFIGARVKVSQLKTFVTVSAESADLLLQHGHTELFEKDEHDYPKKLAQSPGVDGGRTKRSKRTKVISVQDNERPDSSADIGTDSDSLHE